VRRHAGRASAALVLPVLLVGSLAWGAPAGAGMPRDGRAATAVPQRQELIVLVGPTPALAAPRPGARTLRIVSAKRPLTWERTTLPVVGRRTGPQGARWLRVRLPGRPNGQTGWIRRSATLRASTPWHLVVDLAARRTTVYHSGHRIRTFPAIIGKPSTPTPRGRFFVEESVAMRARDVGGPYALALSARSDVLQVFAGGPGQIALHGRRNVGGVLGTAVSHGCVRLDDDAMRWLAQRIGPGTPVTIRG